MASCAKMSQVFDANVDDLDGVELDVAATSIQPSCNEEITSSKTSVSNDCFHVLHSYTEFNSSSPLLLTSASKYDDDNGRVSGRAHCQFTFR